MANEVLATFQIGANATQTSNAVSGLGAPRGIEVTFEFNCVGGGGTVDIYLQTTVNAGNTWWDICNFHGTTASLNRLFNPDATGTATNVGLASLSLTSNTVQNGLLGDQVRAVCVTAGTAYTAGSSVAVTINPRY